MPADASIYNAFATKPKSALEYQQDYAAADDAKLGREVNLLKVQSARQEAQDSNGLRNYLSGGADLSTPEGQAGLYRAAPTKAGAILKSQAEISKERALTGKAVADTSKAAVDTEAAQFKLSQDRRMRHLQELTGVNDVETAAQWLDQAAASGELPPDRVAQVKQQLIQNPQSLQQWKQGAIAAGFTLQQQAENEWKQKEFSLKQDQFGETVRHNKVGEGTAAGQLGVAQGNLGLRQQELQQGKVTPGYRVLPNGDMQAIPGGPADVKATKETTAKTSEARDVLALLDQATPLIDKATSSYAGAATDQAMRVVGASNPGAQAAAQLRALEGALISKMPKMSGPQSDKDVLLYKQMAGQIGDPTIPAPQKKAAMQTIREINERQVGGAPAAAPASASVRISGDSDYAKLPSGATFIAPDGKTRRKP